MRSHPQNEIGLLALAKIEVLVNLTSSIGKVLYKLRQLRPDGSINIVSGFRVAQLALKHRQDKQHKMRIIAFIGSPISADSQELITLAKKLRKEKVNVDVVCLGEEDANIVLLTGFIDTLNGKDGINNNLVMIPPCADPAGALVNSPIVQGEVGLEDTGLSLDQEDDADLAYALKVSLEEYHRQQALLNATDTKSEINLLKEPLSGPIEYDLKNMTEEEKLALAEQISLKEAEENIDSLDDDDLIIFEGSGFTIDSILLGHILEALDILAQEFGSSSEADNQSDSSNNNKDDKKEYT